MELIKTWESEVAHMRFSSDSRVFVLVTKCSEKDAAKHNAERPPDRDEYDWYDLRVWELLESRAIERSSFPVRNRYSDFFQVNACFE